MKITFTLLLASCCFGLLAQTEQTYRIIIFPSDERNEPIYDITDKNGFGASILKYYEDNCIQYAYWEANHIFKDPKDFKQIIFHCNSYISSHSFFFSPKMDLYIFQQKDAITGSFFDIGYEFNVILPSGTAYLDVISIDLRELKEKEKNKINSSSILNNENLYAFQEEYKFTETKSNTFSSATNIDFNLIREKPMGHIRIREYGIQDFGAFANCGNHLLSDLQSHPENLKTMHYRQMSAIDSSELKFFFQYDKNEAITPLQSRLSDEDSTVTTAQGDVYIPFKERDRFDITIKDLSHIQIMETGTYHSTTHEWIYQAIAISLKFSPEIANQPMYYEPMWFCFSEGV